MEFNALKQTHGKFFRRSGIRKSSTNIVNLIFNCEIQSMPETVFWFRLKPSGQHQNRVRKPYWNRLRRWRANSWLNSFKSLGRTSTSHHRKVWRRTDRDKIKNRFAKWNELLGRQIIEEEASVFEVISDESGSKQFVGVLADDTDSTQPKPLHKDDRENDEMASAQRQSQNDAAKESEAPSKLTARCKVTSLLSDHSIENQLHHARYKFVGDVRGAKIIFTEPKHTRISSILVNGNALVIHQAQNGSSNIQFHLSETERDQAVDVFFQTNRQSGLAQRRSVELPDVSFNVVSLDWDLKSSTGTQITRGVMWATIRIRVMAGTELEQRFVWTFYRF